jgi:hypothetical protein
MKEKEVAQTDRSFGLHLCRHCPARAFSSVVMYRVVVVVSDFLKKVSKLTKRTRKKITHGALAQTEVTPSNLSFSL